MLQSSALTCNLLQCRPEERQHTYSNVIVVVEADGVAEVVVLVPARAAAMAGPLVRPEAVVSCAHTKVGVRHAKIKRFMR